MQKNDQSHEHINYRTQSTGMGTTDQAPETQQHSRGFLSPLMSTASASAPHLGGGPVHEYAVEGGVETFGEGTAGIQEQITQRINSNWAHAQEVLAQAEPRPPSQYVKA